MNDQHTNPGFTIDEDPVLDQLLASLEHFAPARGFEDRVMGNVITPAPRWLQRVQARGHALVQHGRGWWFLGGLTGVSAISASAIVALLILNAAAVRESLDGILTAVGMPLWRGMLGIAAETARDIGSLINSVSVSASVILAAGASVVFVLVFNTWAICRLMRPVRAKGVEFNVSR